MYDEYEGYDYDVDDIDLSDYECVEDEEELDEEIYSNQCTWCDGCGCNRCL
jgi:hypothetical protein